MILASVQDLRQGLEKSQDRLVGSNKIGHCVPHSAKDINNNGGGRTEIDDPKGGVNKLE